MLDRRRLRRRHVERARDRDVERPAAPVEHARELADAPVRDGEGRAVVADVDDDLRAGRRGRVGCRRRRERAQQRERLEVDPGELDARPCLHASDVAVDELAVGDDEQHAPDGLPAPRRRARRAPASRAPPPRAGSAASPARGSGSRSRAASGRRCRRSRRCGRRCGCSRCRAARPSSAACASRRSSFERGGERLRCRAARRRRRRRRERLARDLHELRRAVRVRDPRGRDLRRADLQADEPALALRRRLLLLRRLRRLRALGRLRRLRRRRGFGFASFSSRF